MNRKKISLELRVGIFVITAIVLIIVFIFSQASTGKYRGYEIGILFDYVGGLESGSPVRVSGVRAGEVKKIEILYEAQPKVLARVKLRQDIKISTDSRITIQTLGLIGEKYIEITPSPVKKYVQPGEIIEGESPVTMEKLVEAGQNMIIGLNTVLSDISKITGNKELQENIKTVISQSASAIEKIETTFTDIQKLSLSLSETGKKIDNVISVNAPKIEELLNNTNELIYSGKIKMEETVDEIKQFVSAGTKAAESFEDIEKAAISFEKTSNDIQEFLRRVQNEGIFAKLLQEEEMIDQLKYGLQLFSVATIRFTEASERISEATININKIVADIERGRGTAGKLLKDEELYNNLNEFVKDIKTNPWKLFIRRR